MGRVCGCFLGFLPGFITFLEHVHVKQGHTKVKNTDYPDLQLNIDTRISRALMSIAESVLTRLSGPLKNLKTFATDKTRI